MNKINNIFLYLILFILSGSLSQAWASQSEAQYKKLSKTFVLNSDGSQEMRYSMELTLFTHTAMNGTYGETFVVYNPKFQELKITSSYTKQKDGTIIKTPDNAFVPVLPANAANAPYYNHLVEMVIVHTGLELGATIYLDYTLTSKAGYLKELDIYEELLQSSPVNDYSVTVKVPNDKKLLYELVNNNAKPSVSSGNSMQTFEWNFRNLPAISRDAFINSANGDLPILTATTYESQSKALAVLYNQFNKGADSQLLTIVEDITQDASSDKEKVKNIMEYITSLDNNKLTLEQTGYTMRNASEVVSTAYGTELEKVNLLNALLNNAEISAKPIALYKVKDCRAAGLKTIDQVLVECNIEGDKYYLTPFSFSPSKIVTLNNLVAAKYLENGDDFELSNPRYSINYNAYIQLKDGKASAKIKENIGRDISPYLSEERGETNIELAIKQENGYAVFQLPEAFNGITNLGFDRLNSDRKNNIILPRLVDENYSYTIEIPSDMKVSNSKEAEVTNEAGTYKCSILKDGDKYKINRSLKLNKQLYTPKEYRMLRELLINWCSISDKSLIITTK